MRPPSLRQLPIHERNGAESEEVGILLDVNRFDQLHIALATSDDVREWSPCVLL